MAGLSQPIPNAVFDFARLVLCFLPRGLAIVAVILIPVELQKDSNQDCKNYDEVGRMCYT